MNGSEMDTVNGSEIGVVDGSEVDAVSGIEVGTLACGEAIEQDSNDLGEYDLLTLLAIASLIVAMRDKDGQLKMSY